MRFNSVKRNDFTSGARGVVKSMNAALDAGRSSGVDFTGIANEAIKGRSMERRAAMEAEGQVARAGLQAAAKVKGTQVKADGLLKADEIKRPARRMAGVVGALGTLTGAAVLAKGTKADKAAAEKRDAAYEARTKLMEDKFAELSKSTPYQGTAYQMPDAPSLKPTPQASTPKKSGSAAPSGDPAPVNSQGIIDLDSLEESGDLSHLTPADYKALAYASTSESGPGNDKYGVAASIITRGLNRNQNIHQVTHAPGQYEGVYKGLSRHDPDLAAHFASPEGQRKIRQALTALNGRTDFKGQTMLKYRSNKGNEGGIMDPMFHPQGNFFHDPDQT